MGNQGNISLLVFFFNGKQVRVPSSVERPQGYSILPLWWWVSTWEGPLTGTIKMHKERSPSDNTELLLNPLCETIYQFYTSIDVSGMEWVGIFYKPFLHFKLFFHGLCSFRSSLRIGSMGFTQPLSFRWKYKCRPLLSRHLPEWSTLAPEAKDEKTSWAVALLVFVLSQS